MSAVKLKKIVFVCTGNTCRSPMAEFLLKKVLKKEKLRGFKVCSAGIDAAKGGEINPKSAAVLAEQGIDSAKFTSTKLTDKTLKEAFAVICMTERHCEYLMDRRWNIMRKAGEEDVENNVYSFGEFAGYDVPDPYGMDVEKYRYVYSLLEGGMYAIIEGLELRSVALPPPEKKAKTTDGSSKKRGRPRKNSAT